MNPTIKAMFGYCVIPRGTVLFRSHPSTDFNICMFFALRYWVARGFNQQRAVQIWQTTADVEVLFAVESVDRVARAESALPRIYKTIFPLTTAHYDDLDIKQRDVERRNSFIKELKQSHSIGGWFTSLEGGQELEICLFSDYGIVLVETIADASKKYPLHSLNQIQIFPTDRFRARSYDRLAVTSHDPIDIELARLKYMEHIQALKDDDYERYGEEDHPDEYTDLRTKLNI